MLNPPVKKFYVEFVGSLPVRWGIELQAINEEVAKEEARRSLPEFSADWSIGDGNEQVVDAEIVSVADLGTQETPDHVLGRLELERKYTEDNEYAQHREHDKQCWIERVNDGYTLLGYWDWVYEKVQEGQQDATQTSAPEE